MNETLQRVRERLGALNERLSTGQKLAIAGLGAVLIATIGALSWFAMQPEYATLHSGLDPAEAGKVVDELKSRKVPVRVTHGGSTIEVPADQVYELRLSLAAGGLGPKGGMGYEWLDNSEPFGMPDDLIQLNKKRMLEGELARSIASLAEVNGARVHLALPQESLFVEDQRPATASVIVDVKPGGVLAKRQISGIVNLVANAVPRLDPDKVSIVDQRGKLLNSPDSDLAGGTSSLEYQSTLERELERKATEVLEKFVGVGKAVVTVRAKLDFSREQRTEELYDPEKQVVRSEETLSEQRENGGNRVGGAAGAQPNDPNAAQGVIRVGDASNSTREKVVTNYEINKVVKQVQGPIARVERLSVAVIVDGKYMPLDGAAPAEDGNATEKQYVARTAEEMVQIRKLVAKAVEFDANRGDDIEVANVQFEQLPVAQADAALAAAEREKWITFFTKYGLILLLGLLLVFFVFRPMMRTLTARPEVAEVLDEGDLPPDEALALPGAEKLAELEQRELTLLDKVREYVKDNPEAAAGVMRYWLRESAQQPPA